MAEIQLDENRKHSPDEIKIVCLTLSRDLALLHACVTGDIDPHSRSQRPRSFWSAPGIETSGRFQNQKSAIHGLVVKYDKSDWLKNTE